ncbi:hypothetical protein AAFF_G00290650 [Aldrovandia affinis]|uniref:Folate receptor-like domain-containing protein n=1 Tax=Aldrovandia affinis TaxID=143900 RepID=A0AAD7W1N8_9TELE|nr:hypothetical protein AAFF_G00290650 [Aldrovandia affinis]
MGIFKNCPKPLPLIVAYILASLIGRSGCQEGSCLQDGKHKAAPGPERYLKECALYTDNACCSRNDIQEITASPVSRVDGISWDRCGALSPSCQSFFKRVACFQRCSPDAARWPHPHSPASIQGVPLCTSFCRDWFQACKADRTCARNWVSDWKHGPQGNNCPGTCVTYQQMYQDGQDLCESLWGDRFVSVEDEAQDGPGGTEGRSCGCLSLSPSDREAMAALRAQEGDPEELDTTKTGRPEYRAPCRHNARPQGATLAPEARRGGHNTGMHKRSLFMEDVEGSSSGL